MTLTIYIIIVTLLSFILKGITGFGNTLIMASLLSFVISPKIITPIDLLLGLPINLFLVLKERDNLNFKIVIPLSLLLLFGAIPGSMVLKYVNDNILKSILGLVIIFIGVEMFIRKNKTTNKTKKNPLVLAIIGIFSGLIAGVFGIGAFLVAYIQRTTDNHSQFRVNLCFVFLVENVFRFITYYITGIFNSRVFYYSIILYPVVIIGLLIGFKLSDRMEEEIIQRLVILFLIISGSLLFLRNVI